MSPFVLALRGAVQSRWWGLRRFVSHRDARADQIRGASNSFVAVQGVAPGRRALPLGSDTKISYAADLSEYLAIIRRMAAGECSFHLDPLWADVTTSIIGSNTYMPVGRLVAR